MNRYFVFCYTSLGLGFATIFCVDRSHFGWAFGFAALAYGCLMMAVRTDYVETH